MHDPARVHATPRALPPSLFVEEELVRLCARGAPFGMLENHNQTSCLRTVANRRSAARDAIGVRVSCARVENVIFENSFIVLLLGVSAISPPRAAPSHFITRC